jgi:hypothetical protein
LNGMSSNHIHKCKLCGFSGTGNYCSHCGQSLKTKRISLKELLRELFHSFTHIEKGFFYTLKQLIVAPGRMQLTYIEGKRNIHQKPFSMFLMCATLTALFRYWIFNAVSKYYHTDIMSEARFFHEYMVITFVVLLPVYVLVTYLLFYKSGYNYAEVGVMMLYTISVCFLMAGLIALLKLIYPHLDTAFIEFPIFAIYFTVTLLNFFRSFPLWKIAIKSLIILSSIYLMEQVVEDFIIRFIS